MEDKLLIKKSFWDFSKDATCNKINLPAIRGWTGFNLSLRYKQSEQQDNLPIINALTISMTTIHEILCLAMQIKYN